MPKWEETENEIRHRVKEPGDFKQDTFRTKTITTKEGKEIKLIVGKKTDKGPMEVQAYHFPMKNKDNKNGWTKDEAKKWIEDNEGKASLGPDFKIRLGLQIVITVDTIDEMLKQIANVTNKLEGYEILYGGFDQIYSPGKED